MGAGQQHLLFSLVCKINWDLAQSLPPSCPRAIHLPRQREAKQYLLLSHSKPLRKSAILNNFVWFHDMPPSDEGGGNRKVDGGRDNAKQKFILAPHNRNQPLAGFPRGAAFDQFLEIVPSVQVTV